MKIVGASTEANASPGVSARRWPIVIVATAALVVTAWASAGWAHDPGMSAGDAADLAAAPFYGGAAPAPLAATPASTGLRASSPPAAIVAVPPVAATPQDAGLMPASTTEIPQAPAAGNVEPSGDPADPDALRVGIIQPDDTPDQSSADNQIISYEQAQDPNFGDSRVGTMQEFLERGEEAELPLGIQVREDVRTLSSGREMRGLLIVEVARDGPAAHAGIHGYHHFTKTLLEVAAVAGTLFFPPAIAALPVIDQTRIGESYDMIIGVDGTRVTDFIGLEDQLHNAQPGEIVYLNLLRNGQRAQVPVPLPNFSSAMWSH